MPKLPLQKVEYRQIRTFYEVREVLSCGHAITNLGSVAADPLIAKYRACPKCAAIPQVPKKPPAKEAVNDAASYLRKVSG